MKILLITSEEWNDYVYANGVLTNWFTGFDAEFAQIYTSPGKPINNVCDKYFQITDTEMAKSIFGEYKAGREITKPRSAEDIEKSKNNERRRGVYMKFKRLSQRFYNFVKLIQDFIWVNGHYDVVALEKFVKEFNPDVVFCPRRISPKLIRLEKLVSTMTDAPFVAFTGDDEASLDGKSISPLFWFRKIWIHNKFKKHTYIYSHYLMHSEDQAREYTDTYHVPTSTIYKCGDFPDKFIPKTPGHPIKMVYAGRLYCNRWKSLAQIGEALKHINKDGVIMILEIYTQEQLSEAQVKALTEDRYIYLRGSVPPYLLPEIYRNADIALHVEAMDDIFKQVTRVSFSTKIIDLMNSSCAIMAICWNKHCGYQYLKKNNAAFCISDYSEILPMLVKISEEPDLIKEYAEKAYLCGVNNHSRSLIQRRLMDVFTKVISEKSFS